MRAIFRGRRAFVAAVVWAGSAICFLCSLPAQNPGGPLAAFLAGQIAPEVREFGSFSREKISLLLQKVRVARGQERAIAVGNLQHCAWALLDTPATVSAAVELLDLWVMPHVGCLRVLPQTSGCSWERVVPRAYACYKKAGDAEGERRTLELLATQARDSGLCDLAFLRLAALKAGTGDLEGAIALARKCNPRGEFASAREKLLTAWEKSLKENKT